MAEQTEDREILKLRSIMTTNVAKASPRTSLVTVCRTMARRQISCVVVVRNEQVLGIVSERDIVQHAVGAGKLSKLSAGKIMTSPVQSLSADMTVERAIALIIEKGLRRIPIVERDGTLAGIVTQSDVMKAFTHELEIAHERMRDLAIRDCLTGMFNRRFFMASIEKEFYRSRRYGTPLSLIMLDLDDFKDVNDKHGHQYGDEVLKSVAEVIRRHSRLSDVAARFGGEEFTVLLPATGVKEARVVAERLRQAVAGTGQTASVGVSFFPKGEARFSDDLIRQADWAMYEAKRKGKNQAVFYTPSLSEKRNEP